MRAAFVALAFAACVATSQAAVEIPAAAVNPVPALQSRVKDIEALNARNGMSVFSFRLAGLLTASASTFAPSILSAADVDAGKALQAACATDMSTLCAELAEVPAGAPLPDAFQRNLETLKCLESEFRSVSDACVDAAHTAGAYMRDNEDTLKALLKQLAVKDTFEAFKSACAPEVAARCNTPIVDPTDAVPAVLSAFSKDENDSLGKRGGFHRMLKPARRLHGGHRDSSSESESESEGDLRIPGKAFKALDNLSSSLGVCARAVVDGASDTCAPALGALSHVALFVAGGHGKEHHGKDHHGKGGRRSLSRPGGKGPSGWAVDDDKDSSDESSSDESSSDEEGDVQSHRRGGGGHGRKHKDDAGGVVALGLIIAVVTLSVCLCRRRRQIRDLTQRLHQLEMAMWSGQGRAAAPVAVGIPMPQGRGSIQRAASDAVAEDAGLLQRSQAQPQAGTIVMPPPFHGQVYPGQAFAYPTQ